MVKAGYNGAIIAVVCFGRRFNLSASAISSTCGSTMFSYALLHECIRCKCDLCMYVPLQFQPPHLIFLHARLVAPADKGQFPGYRQSRALRLGGGCAPLHQRRPAQVDHPPLRERLPARPALPAAAPLRVGRPLTAASTSGMPKP